MAIKLIANYSKRLGLPGYSSHQFSVSVETELVTTDNVAFEAERLYQRLQATVDEQMLHTGFVPPKEYGMDVQKPNNVIPHQPAETSNLNPAHQSGSWLHGPAWQCSARQKGLILKLVDEHHLKKAEVEDLAIARFGKGVTLLSKGEASAFIDALLKMPKEAVIKGVVTTIDDPASDGAYQSKNAA